MGIQVGYTHAVLHFFIVFKNQVKDQFKRTGAIQ